MRTPDFHPGDMAFSTIAAEAVPSARARFVQFTHKQLVLPAPFSPLSVSSSRSGVAGRRRDHVSPEGNRLGADG